MGRHIAIYVRVSSKRQDTKSQEPDLKRWADAQDGSRPIKFYTDRFTGKTMERPGWKKLEKAIRMGRVSDVVVWRIDRLGRTAAGLVPLFKDLSDRNVNLVSLKDGLDLSTAAGRLMANVLASVAEYDNELRRERTLAGQSVAKSNGKTWGGSKPGVRKVVTPDQIKIVKQLKAEGMPVTRIAKAVRLSRPTIYSIIGKADQ